jgi:hypothetical protein
MPHGGAEVPRRNALLPEKSLEENAADFSGAENCEPLP